MKTTITEFPHELEVPGIGTMTIDKAGETVGLRPGTMTTNARSFQPLVKLSDKGPVGGVNVFSS